MKQIVKNIIRDTPRLFNLAMYVFLHGNLRSILRFRIFLTNHVMERKSILRDGANSIQLLNLIRIDFFLAMFKWKGKI